MSHIRESFPILEDGTEAGVALSKSENGDASAGKVGATVWAFKDSSGNLVHPQLNSEGKLPVSFDGAGVPYSATSDGEVAGSLTLTTVAEITLANSKTYGKIYANGSCFKEAIFYLIQQDDATETIISQFIVGPGDYNGNLDLVSKEIVSGATGTQKLILKAINLQKESDFLGDVGCLELV